ncbi:MAG: phage integrase Arm DNA-binding domain-containing protein [Candidatus Thiodiazotropha endolucinida]|nr:phage integrase Arm DNA-binding domain-containing protein [Candidatus Thiodiazotropha taylori]MCW4315636.1 phage integrase Arm DNA-binding domain-containing protein [Candidatus Thiodiazotropha taylori]
MSRLRQKGQKDLPQNCYKTSSKGKIYYRYRLPDGRFRGLGSNREKAVIAANQLNQKLQKSHIDLAIDRALSKSITVEEVFKAFHSHAKNTRNLKESTLRTRKSSTKRLLDKYGKCPIQEIKTKHISELLEEYENEGKGRSAQVVRSTLQEMWRWAITKGHIQENIVTHTKVEPVKVRRSRLELEQFNKIVEKAKTLFDPWVADSMLLALVTCQRLEDIALMKFAQVKDDFLFVQQSKTHAGVKEIGSKVQADINIRLNAIDMSIDDAIKRCRNDVISRSMIHHTKNYGNAPRGAAVHENTISRKFTACVRALGDELTWEAGKTPATFHEIRSLSIRLYSDERSKEFAQALAGHKDAASTETYTDERSEKWVVVK